MIFLEEEFRAYCPTGEGNGIDNSCSAGGNQKADDSWKQEVSVSLSGDALRSKPPYKGASKAAKVEIPDSAGLQAAMASLGIPSLDSLAVMGAATVRGSRVEFQGGRSDIYVTNTIPIAKNIYAPSEGSFEIDVSLSKDDGETVLYFGGMYPDTASTSSPERIAKATSIMQQAVIESIMAADGAGVARVDMAAAGGEQYSLKGYRLWPQFGFDGPLDNSHKHALAKADPALVEKVMRLARPDLFATRIQPSAGVLAAAVSQSPITVQHLISSREGDRWWDKNGSTLSMTLDLKNKKSLGYAKFQQKAKLLARLKGRNQDRSYFEWLEDVVEHRAADCGRVAGGQFGPKNDCASDEGWSQGDDEQLFMEAGDISASPPFKGSEVLDKFIVSDVPGLKDALSEFKKIKSVANLVKIGGGVRQGGSVDITPAHSGAIMMELSMPVSEDGSDRLGSVINAITIAKEEDTGRTFIDYSSMSLDGAAMSAIREGSSPEDSADRRRIASMVIERMTESMMVAEKSGIDFAETFAAGRAGSALQGYRLWPSFGFDGELTDNLRDMLQESVNEGTLSLNEEQAQRADAGILTVQQLIATPEGNRWWNENGEAINLSFNFKDKKSLGYKRFARMKKILDRAKERNKSRSAFDDDVESRDDCGRVSGGQFGPNNDCASDDGGAATEDKKSGGSKAKKADTREPLKWSPGDDHIDVFATAQRENPTKRSEDGKKILSTDIPGAKITGGFAGKQEIEPLDVGRYLVAQQTEHRGRVINTSEPLEGHDFEYMVSGIVSQVESAVARGVSPNFYSPEDRKAQIEEYAKIQPLMRGGRTASGFCIGVEGPNGECEPSEGISPHAEFLFRAAQALTSPECNPYENMLRADSVLNAFFTEADPAKAKLGAGISLAGAGAGNTLKNFSRLQKIIDRVGIEETRRLFSGPSMRVGDFQRFFLSQVPGSGDEQYKASGYAVSEAVPPFSIFGPKVGPFFANNMGDAEALTADVWFTRTWGRLSGELITETSVKTAKTHGAKLMAATKDISRKELTALGLDGRSFRTLVSQMKQKGEVSQAIVDWAEARYKQYGKDKFPSPDKGNSTQERYALDRIAVNILGNQVGMIAIPKDTVMRSNMIRVMREAAKRTGVPVAYMQDILWQDEQDTWGTLGSRTTTVPGVPSLYSDVIRKIIREPANLNKRRAASRRSLSSVAEPMVLPFYGDQKGGVEQATYDGFMSEISDDDFADLAIEFLKRNAKKEARAFCPTGDGGGVDNSCSSDDGGAAAIAALPKSFPKGSEKFRAAVDSIAPSPKAIWDRSKGLAETPPAKVLTQAADEQETSGKTLTPEAEASYRDLVDEIGRQYEALVAAGLKVHAWRGEGEPYGDPPGSTKPNSDKMRAEVAKTGEFSFFMTDKGFGTGDATPDHPMLRETKYKTADGEPMIANDLFRVVHDMVAHVRGGYSFSTNGEFNGMLTHASTLPESAWPALFAETFGQNAVYEKTGNYAAQNAYASKIGPEVIKAELAKRKSKRAADPAKDGDEPLGYQHLKVRPWLMKGGAESRAYCPTGEGNGIDNSCSASGGTAVASTTAGGSWPESTGVHRVSESELKESPPVTGGEVLASFKFVNGKAVSDSVKAIASVQSLDNAVAIAGGVRAGGKVSMESSPAAFGKTARVFVENVLPISPNGDDSLGSVDIGVAIASRGDASWVAYEHLFITGSNRHAGMSDGNDKRLASLLLERMTESLVTAERCGIDQAETEAAGSDKETLKGYRLWPQFGFDGVVPDELHQGIRELAERSIASRGEDNIDNPPEWAVELMDALDGDEGPLTLQKLISSREGEKWWDKNGSDIYLTFDFNDKASRGYKRFEEMKARLARLKGRNVGREWLPEDTESRAYCPTGEGNGIDNSCSASDKGKEPISAGDKSLKSYEPFTPAGSTRNSDFAIVPSDEEAIAALKEPQREKYGAHRALQAGYPIDLRIDIPAFENHGTYVVTAHEHVNGAGVGAPIGYDSIIRLKGDVDFRVGETAATKIARGKTSKNTHSTVKGKFDPSREIPEDIDDWTPVGYNPKTATYYYDKRNGQEIVGGVDSISVGNSVFVRVPKYGNGRDPSAPPRNAKTDYRSADCGRDESGKFGSGNKCQVDGDGSLRPQSVQKYPGEPSYQDQDDDYVYHITTSKNADSIVSGGFRRSPPTVKGGAYENYSKGKVFFTEKSGLATWKDKIEEHLFHSHDDPPPVSIVRVKKSEVSHLLEPDEVGSKDAGAKAYYVDLSGHDKKSKRSADCGRDESGKFGSGNDCASDGNDGGAATAAPTGGRWSSNETLSWPETSRDTSQPPVGDGRYGSINVSAPKAVKASLDAAGIDPKLAPMVAGGSPESDVFVRPAPDFSMEFPDSNVTPVMFAFERDFAGVESGLHGSSVIGVTAAGETVVYHSTVNVSDSIKNDAAKRHAAAREFYRAMTASVESARKAGVSRIVLNAAGNSSATKGSLTSTPWRGYTIWPRMGFDAPLPPKITAKLPPDLSHAKSLLDLHATPEGTRWWRDNGEDLDVTFDLKDRSSPQAKIMDRFIKKFGESRREMPLGAGDEWMSPEDLLRLDEMWQEIWDDGELDDYEWVESRSADCGRDDGGRFDEGNQCQRGAGKVAEIARAGASHEELTAAIAEAIGTKRGWFSGPEKGEASPSAVCEALGLKVANDWIVDQQHAESSQHDRESIARTIAEAYLAVQKVPDLKNIEFHIQTAESMAKWVPSWRRDWEATKGVYMKEANEIHILAGTAWWTTHEDSHETGWSSTPSPAHTFVHEAVHREHYEHAAKVLGLPRQKGATDMQSYARTALLDNAIENGLAREAIKDAEWLDRCERKVAALGSYATSHPFEFVAEYSTAVKLGYVKNDPDLDRMCKSLYAPVPKKARAA